MGQQYLSTDPNAGDPLPRSSVLLQGRMSAADVSDAPMDGVLSRLMGLLEPMAHPQTMDDFGHLLMSPVDATRGTVLPSLVQKLRQYLPSRKTAGSAVERIGQELQHPVQVPGRVVEGAGKLLKGPEPPPAPMTPKPRPGSFEEFMSADPARRAEIQSAREAYRLQPRVKTSAPGGTPSVAPPASTPPGSAPATSMRLTSEESQYLRQLVAEGYDEADVLQAIARVRQESPAPSAMSTRTPAPKMTGGAASGPGRLAKVKLSAAESKELQRLRAAGTSEADALDLIQKQRAMQERLGLPTSEQARRSVVDRNATGRWPDE